MAETITLQRPSMLVPTRPLPRILERAKDTIEKIKDLFSSKYSIEEKVQSIVVSAFDFLHSYLGKNYTKGKQPLQIVVANTTKEWAEACAEGYSFPIQEFNSEKAFINYLLDEPKKAIYDKNFSKLIINLEAIRKEHGKGTKAEEACIIATTIHESLHHLCGFDRYYPSGPKDPKEFGKSQFNILWLIDGINELLLRDIMGKCYPKESDSLKCSSYSKEFSLVMKLEYILGHATLITSYFEGNLFPIKLKLKELGLNEDEITELFKLGHDLVECSDNEKGQTYKKLDSLLDKAREKEKRRRKTKGYKEDEGEVYESVEEGAEKGLADYKNLPAQERAQILSSARARLAERNLFYEETDFSPEMASLDELRNHLLENYSGSSLFTANLIIDTVNAHMALQRGEPVEPREIAEFLEEVTRSFAYSYKVKPTLEQLEKEVGEKIYGFYIKKIELSDFIGSYEQKIRAKVEEFKEKFVNTDKRDENEIRTFFGIKNGSVEDLNALFEIASIVPMMCKIPTCDTEVTIVKTILAAQCTRNGIDETQAIEEIILGIKKILNRNKISIGAIDNFYGYSNHTQYLTQLFSTEPNEYQIKAFGKLMRGLGLIYPASIFQLNKKHGLMRYRRIGFQDQSILIPFPSGESDNSGSMGKFSPYGWGNEFSKISERHELDKSLNPLKTGPRIKQTRRRFKSIKDEAKKAVEIYEIYATKNQRIRFDMKSERPDGYLTPEEVLERGYALCLEHTGLFLAVGEGQLKRAFAFKVFKQEEGGLISHVCPGIFLEDEKNKLNGIRIKAIEYAKSRSTYYRFDEDAEYKAEILRRLGVEGTQNTRLVLLDLSLSNFSAQYQMIRPIATKEEFLSAYYVDRGTYYMQKDQKIKALEFFKTALRINPQDEMARSHLIAYYSDIEYKPEKVLELSSNIHGLVNTEDLISRAMVLLSLGEYENAIESLAQAVQISKNAVKARSLLEELLN